MARDWPGGPAAGRPMGERAVLVETGGTAITLALLGALRHRPLGHQEDVVPGAGSVLVRFSEPVDPDVVMARIGELDLQHVEPDGPAEVLIEVAYDGADLDEVGRLTGLGPDGVVTAHSTTPWRVAFCGFAPGFGYLTGGDRRLVVPRRNAPRDRVPAGSVALAGEYSGVYPRASPGGWQLIGRTAQTLWDLDRDPPALLRPGMTVRFRAVRQSVVTGPAVPTDILTRTETPGVPAPPSVTETPAGSGFPAATGFPGVAEPPAMHGVPAVTGQQPPRSENRVLPADSTALTVINAGIHCTVQDLGRPGWAEMGVSPSGAADLGAAVRANRIVGNDVGAAVLELVLGGCEFGIAAPTILAVTGASVEIQVTAESGTQPAAMNAPIPVGAGGRVRLGRPGHGLRSYLGVRGGIAVRPVLGSRSTDLLSGIGPPVVRSGDVLPVGEQHWGTPHPVAGPDPSHPARLELMPGPQANWLAEGIEQMARAGSWTVSPSSNRVAIRLTGPTLRRRTDGELPSQGLVRGAVQLPPSGELVVFLADHPVTGGYPVIGVLTQQAADRAAQLRPGDVVAFAAAPG
jgi:KipI family sensor histidine kinase inhibitor